MEDTNVAERPRYPGTPRWVKMFGIAALVVVLLFVILLLIGGGGHGPGRHTSSGALSGRTLPSSVLQGGQPA